MGLRLGRFLHRAWYRSNRDVVDTQKLLLGNLLASRIEDDKLRWKTLSELSLRLMGDERRNRQISQTAQPHKKPPKTEGERT